MRIRSASMYRYSLPLCEPLVLKSVVHNHRDGLLLEVVTESGVTGWGDAAPLPGYSRESLERVEQELLAFRDGLIGQELADGGLTPHWQNPVAQNLSPASRFAVETAMWDATVRSGSSLPVGTGSIVPVNALLTGGGVAAAGDLINAGYRTLKLKVGRDPVPKDIETVRAIHEAYGNAIRIRLDANRAWSFQDAATFLRALEDVPYEYIEEPLAEPRRLPELVERTAARVALDESLLEIDAYSLRHHSYVKAVVLKPTLLGGLGIVSAYVATARSLGMDPVISAAFESGVAIRTMALAALEMGLTGTALGLDTYRWLAEDVLTPPLKLQQGGFAVSDLLAAGRRIRIDMLEEVK